MVTAALLCMGLAVALLHHACAACRSQEMGYACASLRCHGVHRSGLRSAASLWAGCGNSRVQRCGQGIHSLPAQAHDSAEDAAYPWVEVGKLARHSHRCRCTCSGVPRWMRMFGASGGGRHGEIEQAWRDCDECLREIGCLGENGIWRWPPDRAAIMFEGEMNLNEPKRFARSRL